MHENSTDQTTETSVDSEHSATRRQVLMGLLASVGAVATSSCIDNLEKSVVENQQQSTESNESESAFYNAAELALVNNLANLIIPDTETLGALAVGVPLSMDRLYREWASQESRINHRQDIARVTQALDAVANAPYIQQTTESQIATLSQLDQQAFANETAAASSYRAIKSLIARFYYSSQVGASQELRYELVPGKWEPCIPFEKVGRTWAA